MHRKPIAALLLLASAAACGPGRQPVAAPAPAPVAAPPAPAVETVEPVEEGFALSGAPAGVGADLLGSVQYDLPMQANEWVRMELEFLVYQRHEVVGGWLRNAERYGEFARDVFARYGLPRDLYHLAMIESGFRPTVRSHAGAVGMWQFMTATGRGMGLRIDSLVDERMDPVRSTHAAARHLRDLHRRFRGDWSLAAAAYNAGEGRINRGLGRFGAADFWELAQRGDLAQETRHYVPRLYATTIIARDPVRFGYPAPNPARRFAFDSMRVDLATPLAVLAVAGNLPLNELTELNPHLLRQTAPRDYWVWVPAGQGAALQQAFTASEFRRRGGYGSYRIREGDDLARLAEVSGVSAEAIRSMNLSATVENLRPGTTLRLFADAARVLNARPVQRVARAESGTRRPRVLGDPAESTESATPAASERRSDSSTTTSPRAAGSSGRRAAPETAERNASSTRPSSPASATSSERRSASSSERSSSSAAERRSASSSGRSSSSTPEPRSSAAAAAASERRSGSASSSEARSGSASAGRAGSGERAASRSGASTSAPVRTHEVADGETLWGIARRYETTVDAVRAANGLDEDDQLQPGQTLRIPRASSAPSSATASAPRAQPARVSTAPARASAERTTRSPGTQPAGRRREHTVGDGETLWGIARRYDTTVEKLRGANGLDEDDQIQPGQKLTIPEG
jgi:membrane-bound lytic murein transglycosylase D